MERYQSLIPLPKLRNDYVSWVKFKLTKEVLTMSQKYKPNTNYINHYRIEDTLSEVGFTYIREEFDTFEEAVYDLYNSPYKSYYISTEEISRTSDNNFINIMENMDKYLKEIEQEQFWDMQHHHLISSYWYQ